MARAYDFSDETRAQIAQLKATAEQTRHWYVVGQSACPPGDLPRHVLILSQMKCVFSITVMNSPAGCQTYRHASFSLPEESGAKTPSPIAIFTVAHMFGFTGGEVSPASDDDFEVVLSPAKHWLIGVKDGVVTLGEALGLEELAELAAGQEPQQ